MFIFGIYKASHIPKIRSWLRAVWIIKQARGTTVHPHHAPPKPSPFGATHHRHYTTHRVRTPAAATAASNFGAMNHPVFMPSPVIRVLPTLAVPMGQQQRRGLSGHVAAGSVLQEAVKHTYFFPSSWYVTSPFTGEEVVVSSEFMQHLLNCKPTCEVPWRGSRCVVCCVVVV